MKYLIVPLAALLTSCSPNTPDPGMYLGQGFMAGEVEETSVILQTRLTASDTLVDRDIPGMAGWAAFEIDTRDDFSTAVRTELLEARDDHDFIVKKKMGGLKPYTTYYYRVLYGKDRDQLTESDPGRFRTLGGEEVAEPVSFAVVTGMNYYHFHFGNYNRNKAYSGKDKNLGYPGLVAILESGADYFIGTGDNVYFDHPASRAFQKAVEDGKDPHPGLFNGEEVKDEAGMRKKYHVQFTQARYRELFASVGTYWEKDDHDYRINDSHPYTDFPISHELGVSNFREQLPVTDPEDPGDLTYRTHRMSKDLQIWLLEGRDFRSNNHMEPGPDKTLLGAEQIHLLKESMMHSDATFKLVISPTPWVGPDDMYKSDNHVNPKGFRHEGDALFAWFKKEGFLDKGLYFICGDRHWKYHATHPSGFEEFSCGALVDNNSRAGRLAGDPGSTDPDGRIVQHFIEGKPEEASGGFLKVSVERVEGVPTATFRFFDENGIRLYEEIKRRNIPGSL